MLHPRLFARVEFIDPAVEKVSFPEGNRPEPAAPCHPEINRWIARWENEGGGVRLGRSDDVTILLNA